MITYKFKPSIELDRLDCNCNTCLHLNRDLSTSTKGITAPILKGECSLKKKKVSFIATLSMTQDNKECWVHRRDSSNFYTE